MIKSESGDLSIVRDVLGVSQVPRISFSNSISKTRHDDVLYRTSASYLNVDDISKVNFRLPSKSITEDVGSPSSTDVKGSVTSSPLFNPTPVVFTDEQNQSLSNKWTPPPSNVTFAITSTQVLGTMQDESPSHSKPTFEIDSMSDRHHDAIGAPSYFDTVIQASLESNILPTQPKAPLAFLSPTSTLPEVTNTPEIATVFPYYDTAKLLIDARLNTLSTLAPGKSHNGVLLDKIDISPTPTFSARSVDEGRLPSDVNIINDPQVYDSNSNALDVAVGTSRSSSTIINQTGHQDVKSGALSQGADVMVSTGTSVSLHSVLLFEEGREISTSFTISSTTPGDVLRPSSDSQVAKDESALPAGTVAGIVIASVGFVVILSSKWMTRRSLMQWNLTWNPYGIEGL